MKYQILMALKKRQNVLHIFHVYFTDRPIMAYS